MLNMLKAYCSSFELMDAISSILIENDLTFCLSKGSFMDSPSARLHGCSRWRTWRMVTDRPGTGWQTSSILCTGYWFQLRGLCWYGSSQGRPATQARASRLLAWKREMWGETILLSWPVRIRDMIRVLQVYEIMPTGNCAERPRGFSLFFYLQFCVLRHVFYGYWIISELRM